jgi:hypothetical protein
MKPFVACGLTALALCAGCPDRSISILDPTPVTVSTKDIQLSADIDVLFVIDDSPSTEDKQIVFADNYPKFVTALSNFPIGPAQTGLPNLHVAVVTTSIDVGVVNTATGVPKTCHPSPGENGLLQTTTLDPTFTCQGGLKPGATERYLTDIAAPDGTRQTNYTGTLDQALACISHAGDVGCGYESPLEAMKRALDGTTHPENAGFLRPGAFLAVVILTDEDDCSADPKLFAQPDSAVGPFDLRCTQQAFRCDQPILPNQAGQYTNCSVRTDGFLTDPATYASFLTGLKGATNVAVAVIAGDPTKNISIGDLKIGPDDQPLALEPSCQATINGNLALGRPANRLSSFISNFGSRGLFRTVCQADYSGALTDISNLLINSVSPCIEGALDVTDTDPNNPGIQPDCSVSDVVETAGSGSATGTTTETLIPPCKMSDPTTVAADQGGAVACWWLKPDPVTCQTPSQLSLQVVRTQAAATGSKERVSCALTAP